MGLLKKGVQDPATRKLQDEGLLRLRDERKHRVTTRKLIEFGRITYDFWSGVKYILILSIMMWWIPLFGPMIAGYVGGRRTGGPKKGLLAAIFGVGIVWLIHFLLSGGYLYIKFDTIMEYPEKLVGMAYSSSIFGPYMEFLGNYWSSFFDQIVNEVPLGANSYIITLIFAYIGGLISLERRKEFTHGIRSLKNVRDEPSSYHRYSRTPVQQKAHSSGLSNRSLEDLKAVRCNGGSKRTNNFKKVRSNLPNKSNKKTKKQKISENNVLNENDFKKAVSAENALSVDEDNLPKNSVRHHSASQGDDWEFL